MYATSAYERSLGSLARTTLASDHTLRDDFDQLVATMTGTVYSGLMATLEVAL